MWGDDFDLHRDGDCPPTDPVDARMCVDGVIFWIAIASDLASTSDPDCRNASVPTVRVAAESYGRSIIRMNDCQPANCDGLSVGFFAEPCDRSPTRLDDIWFTDRWSTARRCRRT